MCKQMRSINEEITAFLKDGPLDELHVRLLDWRETVQVREKDEEDSFQIGKDHGLRADEMAIQNKDYERWLERRLYDLHSLFSNDRKFAPPFLQGSCECIIGYQVPLKDKLNQPGRWGSEIDLLGVGDDTERRPVVVELKTGKSGEKPSKMLLEGVVYALAIQKLWNDTPKLKAEFICAIEKLGFTQLNGTLMHLTVICLAGEKYWENWEQRESSERTRFRNIRNILGLDIMGDGTTFKIVCASVLDDMTITEKNF